MPRRVGSHAERTCLDAPACRRESTGVHLLATGGDLKRRAMLRCDGVRIHVKDVLDRLLAGDTNYDGLRPDVWKQSPRGHPALSSRGASLPSRRQDCFDDGKIHRLRLLRAARWVFVPTHSKVNGSFTKQADGLLCTAPVLYSRNRFFSYLSGGPRGLAHKTWVRVWEGCQRQTRKRGPKLVAPNKIWPRCRTSRSYCRSVPSRLALVDCARCTVSEIS
jgi:hypothetical protein